MKSLRVLLSLSLMSLVLTVLGGTGCGYKLCTDLSGRTPDNKAKCLEQTTLETVGCMWVDEPPFPSITGKCVKKTTIPVAANCVVGTQNNDCADKAKCKSEDAKPDRCEPTAGSPATVVCAAPSVAKTCGTNCVFRDATPATCAPL